MEHTPLCYCGQPVSLNKRTEPPSYFSTCAACHYHAQLQAAHYPNYYYCPPTPYHSPVLLPQQEEELLASNMDAALLMDVSKDEAKTYASVVQKQVVVKQKDKEKEKDQMRKCAYIGCAKSVDANATFCRHCYLTKFGPCQGCNQKKVTLLCPHYEPGSQRSPFFSLCSVCFARQVSNSY